MECKFTDDIIREYWLSDLKVKVRTLDIIKSNLMYILPDAFDSDVFRASLLSLTVDNDIDIDNPFVFQMISKGSFKGLTRLSSLIITSFPTLNVLDKAALDFLTDSLITLRISQIADTWTPNSLFASAQFKKINEVDLQFNNFPSLDGSSFTSIGDTVETLILIKSNIKSIAVDTFSKFKVLQLLFLQNNLLTSIPAEVFENLWQTPGFVVNLRGNIFHCDCTMVPMQAMIESHKSSFDGVVRCSTPKDLEEIEIIFAHLCEEETEESQETTLNMLSSFSGSSSPDIGCRMFPNAQWCQTTTTVAATTTAGQTFYCFQY